MNDDEEDIDIENFIEDASGKNNNKRMNADSVMMEDDEEYFAPRQPKKKIRKKKKKKEEQFPPPTQNRVTHTITDMVAYYTLGANFVSFYNHVQEGHSLAPIFDSKLETL